MKDLVEDKYLPVPQPEDIPIRVREDAMGAYLMMFAALAAGLPLPILNLIASLIYFYIHKDKGPFMKFHLLQSLYSQLITSAMNIFLVFWTVRIFFFKSMIVSDYYKGYIAVVVIANLMYFIFSVLAAIRARQGRFYYFLVFGKWAYHSAFKVRNIEVVTIENKAPY